LVASCLASIANAQCATTNNANCVYWVRNGFCNNAAYTIAQKQAYCPLSCPVGCGAAIATTTVIPTTDQNPRCAAWAANLATPFCVNTLTAAQKRFYCATTCAFEITPNADCSIYTSSATAFARGTPVNRTPTPGAVVPTALAAGTTITRVYVGSACTLNLY
ncbi:hypothetical protein PFISCL1PPCAC_27889, partial [Pristionchus fissidentatus]